MKKFVLLASVVAIVVAALALPAMAGERWDNDNWWKDHDDNNHSWWKDHDDDDNNWWKNHDDNWWDNGNWWKDHDDRNDDRNDDDDDAAPVITQEFDQEAESGDVSQSFNVSNTGDNSNQCVGLQGVANTGNAQNQISVVQSGSEADDFSFEDSGSSIVVSPSNSTSCDQEVNQAATAYHGW